MQFHEYADAYSRAKKIYKKLSLDRLSYYRHVLLDKQKDEELAARLQLMSEDLWYESERAYYRIYPDYAAIFSRTSLDIPVKYVVSPFKSFAIRFAVGHEPLYKGGPVASVLVTVFNYLTETQSFEKRLGLSDMIDYSDEPMVVQRIMHLCTFVAGPKSGNDQCGDVYRLCWYEHPAYDPVTVEGLIDRVPYPEVDGFLINNMGAEKLYADNLSDWSTIVPLFRIAMSVCFLGSGMDKIIEPDVVNSDFEAYLAAVNARDDGAVKRLHRKANALRGGVGYSVGRLDHREQLLGRRAPRYDGRVGDHEGDGRELDYQHQRGGHMHRFWGGPNRDQLLLKWVRQLTVRPDLPVDPRDRGYRTLRDKKEME